MTTEVTSPKKLFLLDAYALIYRSYFAFIRNPRFNSKGLNTSAIYGFVTTLEQVLSSESPTHIAVAFDVHGDTFRHEMYPEYKANREKMPEDIRAAIPYIRKIIEAYNIPIIEKLGFEADDVIGTLAKKASAEGFITYMMTPDKDYAQLVSENIWIYKPAKNGAKPEVWGIEEVKQNFEITNPLQVIDVLGLMGDTADNVPGCPGIGPKSAMKLIADFGSVEGVYENIDQLKGKQKENLEIFKDQVLLSKQLVIINQDVPIPIDFDQMKMEEPNRQALLELYQELEFRSLTTKWQSPAAAAPEMKLPQQGSLFDVFNTEVAAPKQTFDSIETIKHSYYKIETPLQRASLRAELSVAGAFCFDTETTGLDPHTAELVCISFSFREHEAYCVIIPSDRDEALKVVQEFKTIFEDPSLVKIGQNIKYDMLMLAQYGVNTEGTLFDTLIAHYLIQPELRHNLDYLCELYLGYKKIPTTDLIGEKGASQKTMRAADVEKLVEYSCEDADLTFQLKSKLEKELKDNDLTSLFEQVEMPLIPVLASMELSGVKVDPSALKSFANDLREQLIILEKEIYELAGEEFLISSPKQLGIILFEKLKIDSNVKKTKTKQYSTSEETLSKLLNKHPIVNKLLDYRGLLKLLNTYVDTLPKLINPRTGKIHTSFNQAVASTGRLSSVNPNLQNIPIRDENGKEIRKAFIPSQPGMKYLSADYSQIELRIMASLSNDENMLEAFANNIDIHAVTAAKIFKILPNEVSSDQRRKAKTANFGIIYGISAFGLSQRLTIPRTEAKEIIDGYFEAFPKVKDYMEKCMVDARKSGFVKTLLGRKRYLVDINSANSVVRGVAERNAINAPIQGTAADIIKIAMINIYKRMNDENLKSKMIIQVHDELNFDVFEEEIDTLKKIVKEEMENAIRLNVPLTVEIGVGENWLEAH
ncbi:MAG TPA: DNA polymerase I [Prolixibacteraceae bacterium]|nr:DNA polymerase I [Prolixibacteraceae bacterium]HPR86038.1 DNA polymerase I [Prolixibacteraceae bacterium]